MRKIVVNKAKGSDTNFKNLLPKIYKADTIQNMVFGWIAAKQQEGVNIKTAAIDLQKYLGMNENTFSLESILMQYTRQRNYFIAVNRNTFQNDTDVTE